MNNLISAKYEGIRGTINPETIEQMSYKITIQPVARQWEIFTRGAQAAGFNYLLLDETAEPSYNISLADMYRFSTRQPVPEYFAQLLGEGGPFILRGESHCLLFDTRVTGLMPRMRLYSRKYPPAKLPVLAERILSQLAQQYSYLELTALLSERDYMIADEKVHPDRSVEVAWRRWHLSGLQTDEVTVLSGPQKQEVRVVIDLHGVVTVDLSGYSEEKQEEYGKSLGQELGILIKVEKASSESSASKEEAVLPPAEG